MIEFRLFGPLEISDESGRDLRPKLLKSRAILAVLAATPGHRHSRSWLQSLLWEDRQHTQAMSSLRSALADIRRHLGAEAGALITDHNDVALDHSRINVKKAEAGSKRVFLEGLDIRNANEFEDWVREKRQQTTPAYASAEPREATKVASRNKLFLATASNDVGSVTQMRCDALVDCIAKAAGDLDLGSVVDGRGIYGPPNKIQEAAARAGCDMILIAETAEKGMHSFSRLKLLDCETAQLFWSRSLTGQATLDLESPANVAIVADFIEALTDRLVRPVDWKVDQLSPQLMALTAINQIFKLGSENFRTADLLLKRAHFQNPTGCTLAWRAFLRTFLIGEREFQSREEVIEEGTEMARQAIEADPLNSMVLSLCAHVENMLHDNHEAAFDLSARALTLNRCNPIAWACLGRAAAALDETERGKVLTEYGAKLANGTKYSFLIDSWASSSGLIAQDLVSARLYCEKSHAKSPTFTPPLRFLSALYCADGQYEQAEKTVKKLQRIEPDFSFKRMGSDGYPNETLRRAKLLDRLPAIEV